MKIYKYIQGFKKIRANSKQLISDQYDLWNLEINCRLKIVISVTRD